MEDTPVFDDQRIRCPQCGANGPIPIIYGTPSQEMTIAARLGQIVISDESPSPRAPLWACQKRECGVRF